MVAVCLSPKAGGSGNMASAGPRDLLDVVVQFKHVPQPPYGPENAVQVGDCFAVHVGREPVNTCQACHDACGCAALALTLFEGAWC